MIILVEVLSAKGIDGESISIMNDEAKYQKAEEVKLQANAAFKAQKFDEALILFKEASSYISKLS